MSSLRERLAPICVLALRLSLAGWVGSAVLYVVTSVAEQTSPDFDSRIRDQLATIRFPLYYLFGGIMLLLALISGLASIVCCRGCIRKRVTAAFVFTMLSAAGAAADYVWVYQPLQQLISPPGQARDQRFINLHNWSRHANEVHLTLAMIAAVLACLPSRGELNAGCEVKLKS